MNNVGLKEVDGFYYQLIDLEGDLNMCLKMVYRKVQTAKHTDHSLVVCRQSLVESL